MNPEPKPDQSVAIQQNSADVNLRISYDVNSARNTSGEKTTPEKLSTADETTPSNENTRP
jgi:hypothetical protein